MSQMTANQPYLLSAFFNWIVDNGLTPYVVVDAEYPHVHVPLEFVKDGQIVLNISPSACVNFQLDLEGLSFQARFSGQPHRISMPCQAVLAIYARENGAGTVFSTAETVDSDADDINENTTPQSESAPTPPRAKGKPSLKVIK